MHDHSDQLALISRIYFFLMSFIYLLTTQTQYHIGNQWLGHKESSRHSHEKQYNDCC